MVEKFIEISTLFVKKHTVSEESREYLLCAVYMRCFCVANTRCYTVWTLCSPKLSNVRSPISILSISHQYELLNVCLPC